MSDTCGYDVYNEAFYYRSAVRCSWYNFMWHSLSVTDDMSLVFYGYSGFNKY